MSIYLAEFWVWLLWGREFRIPISDVGYFFIYGCSVSLLVRNVLPEKFLFGPMGQRLVLSPS